MYPIGEFGLGETGAQAALMLEPRAEYYISYWLRFGEGFSWGRGHYGDKLPGLASGDLCSGSASCNGENGYIARLKWRTDGKDILDLYHMDKPRKYGKDHAMRYPSGVDVVFTPGTWFKITERVKINSGNIKDGKWSSG